MNVCILCLFSGGAQVSWCSFLGLSGGSLGKENTVTIWGFKDMTTNKTGGTKKGGIVAFKNGPRACVREWGAYVAQHILPVLNIKEVVQGGCFWDPFDKCHSLSVIWFNFPTLVRRCIFERKKRRLEIEDNSMSIFIYIYIYMYML